MIKDIVFICDDNYCMPTAVCIQSILDCYALQESLTIHVCTFGLSSQYVEKLKSMKNQYVETVINVFDVNNFESRLNVISQKSHVTPTALIKFELPNYFSYLDALLYLDSDVVVKSDISELLQCDLQDHYLAASYEFWEYLRRLYYTLHRAPSKEFYFNSGVMLLNLKKMREDAISGKLWDYKLNRAKTRLMDQESLNAICATNTLPLSLVWNFNPLFNNQQYVKYINAVYHTNYKNADEFENDVKIIHYVGAQDKPWKYSNARMRHYWAQSFQRTPFASKLNLAAVKPERKHFIQALFKRLKEHGLYGTLCYAIFNIENRLKKNV